MLTAAEYASAVQARLRSLADAGRAVQMRAYQRDQFPFLGIQSTPRRDAVKDLRLTRPPAAVLFDIAERLWALPEREFRYVAVDLLTKHHKSLGAEQVPALLALATRDAWWDTVDGLAGVVGDVLQAARRSDAGVQRQMDEALHTESFWLRRIAMIHQLGWRLETDQGRLFGYALQLAPEKEFFIRKAIGWALRDYARWNPEAVRGFIAEHREKLSTLTQREAAKHL